jgi:uncharacterized protein YhfF
MGVSEAAFWAAYGGKGACPPTTRFGDGAAQQDELCLLVLAGRKRATASLALWYGYDRECAPKPGDLSIVLDGGGVARCLIECVDAFETAFCNVDAAFAAEEGEGDGSLAYWAAEHERFFAAELAREGVAFSANVRVVCERFRLVWAG